MRCSFFARCRTDLFFTLRNAAEVCLICYEGRPRIWPLFWPLTYHQEHRKNIIFSTPKPSVLSKKLAERKHLLFCRVASPFRFHLSLSLSSPPKDSLRSLNVLGTHRESAGRRWSSSEEDRIWHEESRFERPRDESESRKRMNGGHKEKELARHSLQASWI